MKKLSSIVVLLVLSIMCLSQDYYWVYLIDKQGTTFNPYEYFDQKAIDRRIKNGLSLNDISDYPINDTYKSGIEIYVDEIVGESRWFNALAVYASKEDILKVKQLDFVKNIEPIQNDMHLASYKDEVVVNEQVNEFDLRPQLKRMGGDLFLDKGIDGKGLRIAIFDGGFPGVDTHVAFEHLRNNNLIIETWNFPKKKEDVYGWNNHGTMVLSCIAGINSTGDKIGLATGSEFLLARTEVGAEPAREEVWWMMAVEWADKNGADIINSSLGYGADRHRVEDMDGQTCLVTRAANMAASKGILVCNAMGNEGDDKTWITLGAPADADSILSVGGIEPSSDFHISFSSFGPTADGRLKPNVVAYGYAMVAQKDGVAYAYGTSFASPLVAGFAACAWQTRPDLTAMEMKAEIEKSGDSYPYYDYAIGYGVPQAEYFTNNAIADKERSFTISEDSDFIIITPIYDNENSEQKIYYHIRTENGQIEYYEHTEFYHQAENKVIQIKKSALDGGKILSVFSNGYTEEFMSKDSNEPQSISESPSVLNEHYAWVSKIPAIDKPKKFGVNAGFIIQPYFSFSHFLPSEPLNYELSYFKSRSFNLGIRYKQNIAKWYSLGCNFEWASSQVRINTSSDWQTIYGFVAYSAKEKFYFKSLNFEIYQRFRLLPSGLLGFGLFWDTGLYGQYIMGAGYYYKIKTESTVIESKESYSDFVNTNYGIRTRIGYGVLSIYAQYRLSDFILNNHDIPKLEAGFELTIPVSM
ncbi:MAG: S8 family serine peptidase [Bacteroidales bacterium]|nr:S8 family serine peptidase [Bacteroidales bacterium]